MTPVLALVVAIAAAAALARLLVWRAKVRETAADRRRLERVRRWQQQGS